MIELISAGLNFADKWFQRKEDQKLRGQQWGREDSFIQRRAADARAAGIHPLAALGAAGPQYEVPYSSGPMAGDIVGDAVAQSRQTKSLDAATKSEIKVNEAQAELLRAQTRSVLFETRNAALGMGTRAVVSDPAGSRGNPWTSTGWWISPSGELVLGPNPEYAMDPTELLYPFGIGAGAPAYAPVDPAAETRRRARPPYTPGPGGGGRGIPFPRGE